MSEAQKQDYDRLADEYNQAQERLEGLETHNEYLQNQVDELKGLVQAFQTARPNLVQATTTTELDSKVQDHRRNQNRGYWCKFDLSNIEITRPLINIILRNKDRPKQFYLEILGDDVVEVSETVLR